MVFSATRAPSRGFTRSSRPQISSTRCRSLCASRHIMPSSKSAPANDFPIARVAASDSGVLAIAKRSSISSGVISFWSWTMIRRNFSMFSRVGSTENLPSSLTPSVGSGAKRLTLNPPGPISTSRPARSGLSSANRTAVPPPSELPTNGAPVDAEVIEEVQQSGRAVAVVLLVLGVLVRVAVARLVDGQHVKVLARALRCCGRSSTNSTRPARRRAAAPRSARCRHRPRGSAGACRLAPVRTGRSIRR